MTTDLENATLSDLVAGEPAARDAADFAASIGAILCDACGVFSSIRKVARGRYEIFDLCQACVENRDYAIGAERSRQALVVTVAPFRRRI